MAQNPETQLSITSDELKPIVRKVVEDDWAEVLDWSFEKMSGNDINPTTAGIYRFSGNAQSRGKTIPWSMILKVLQWVDMKGTPLEEGYLNNPPDWNYWKREALAYQSGILDKVQGNLIPVRCFHTSEPTETSAWIWEEEVREPHRSKWTLDRHLLAARHFGEFAGAYAGFAPNVKDDPWICKQFLRQWARVAVKFGLGDIAQQFEFWEHSYTRQALPQITEQRMQGLIDQIEPLCNALQTLQQTLSHQDANWSNLFATRDGNGPEQTTVIDWSFIGISAIGEDLGMQISSNLSNFYADPTQAKSYYHAAVEAYMDGLRQVGWRGDETAIRFACATAAALRNGTFQVMMFKGMLEDKEVDEKSWLNKLANRNDLTVEETLIRWGSVVMFLFDLADEARELAVQL